MASESFVTFVTAPQTTVLKGRPIIPTPTLAFEPRPFAGFPLSNPSAALGAFSVTCFLLDSDRFDRSVYVDEVCITSFRPRFGFRTRPELTSISSISQGQYAYLNETMVEGRKATVRCFLCSLCHNFGTPFGRCYQQYALATNVNLTELAQVKWDSTQERYIATFENLRINVRCVIPLGSGLPSLTRLRQWLPRYGRLRCE